jgi:hypothetical protein
MSEDFKMQASIKDYDGDMVNFRANSVEELKAEFAGFPFAEYADVKAQLKAMSAIQPALPTPAAPAAQPAPAAAPPPQAQVRTCAHGVRTYKTGTGSRGKWEGYFCALPKGTPGACAVEWV